MVIILWCTLLRTDVDGAAMQSRMHCEHDCLPEETTRTPATHCLSLRQGTLIFFVGCSLSKFSVCFGPCQLLRSHRATPAPAHNPNYSQSQKIHFITSGPGAFPGHPRSGGTKAHFELPANPLPVIGEGTGQSWGPSSGMSCNPFRVLTPRSWSTSTRCAGARNLGQKRKETVRDSEGGCFLSAPSLSPASKSYMPSTSRGQSTSLILDCFPRFASRL